MFLYLECSYLECSYIQNVLVFRMFLYLECSYLECSYIQMFLYLECSYIQIFLYLECYYLRNFNVKYYTKIVHFYHTPICIDTSSSFRLLALVSILYICTDTGSIFRLLAPSSMNVHMYRHWFYFQTSSTFKYECTHVQTLVLFLDFQHLCVCCVHLHRVQTSVLLSFLTSSREHKYLLQTCSIFRLRTPTHLLQMFIFRPTAPMSIQVLTVDMFYFQTYSTLLAQAKYSKEVINKNS